MAYIALTRLSPHGCVYALVYTNSTVDSAEILTHKLPPPLFGRPEMLQFNRTNNVHVPQRQTRFRTPARLASKLVTHNDDLRAPAVSSSVSQIMQVFLTSSSAWLLLSVRPESSSIFHIIQINLSSGSLVCFAIL